eukprot:snap_masked-scaffold_45-processed-gene-1.50-mRNA-1 protein AED:1.00 eAED:1.00 QI:0/-1/0/0/-1/1/1/0/196
MKKVNQRKLIVIGGDWNTHVKTKRIDASNNYGLSSSRNTNGKMLEEFLLKHTMEIVNYRHKTGKKGSRTHAIFKPWNKQIRSSETNFFVTNKPITITSFKVNRKISKDIWQHELKDHMETQIFINLTPHNTKPKDNTEKDLSTYLKMCSKKFDEARQRKLQNTELETKEVDYNQLTKAMREAVDEQVASKKHKGFH